MDVILDMVNAKLKGEPVRNGDNPVAWAAEKSDVHNSNNNNTMKISIREKEVDIWYYCSTERAGELEKVAKISASQWQ